MTLQQAEQYFSNLVINLIENAQLLEMIEETEQIIDEGCDDGDYVSSWERVSNAENSFRSWSYNNKQHFEQFNLSFDCGASKMVIIDNQSEEGQEYVLKIPLSRYQHTEDGYENFCHKEEVISSIIEDNYAELCPFFASCSILSIPQYSEYQFYLMKRAETDEIYERLEKVFPEKNERELDEIGYDAFHVLVTYMTTFLNDKIAMKFQNFIDEYEINDLHSGNFGFINNQPVLIDYSGF